LLSYIYQLEYIDFNREDPTTNPFFAFLSVIPEGNLLSAFAMQERVNPTSENLFLTLQGPSVPQRKKSRFPTGMTDQKSNGL
jgi:hypothetical protein